MAEESQKSIIFAQESLRWMLPVLKNPELVIGLCSPIGTDNKKVRTLIKNELSKYKYESQEYKITDLMKTFQYESAELKESPVEDRYDTYIKYANKLREIFGDSGLLGMMCCGALRGHRRKLRGKPDSPISSQAYIFDQFKRKEEIDVLRQVYGSLFILVSVYSDKAVRCTRLTNKIADSVAVSRPTENHEASAKSLIRRDEEEGLVPTGQRLREVFPLADIFIDIDQEEEAAKTVTRFFQAFFGSNAVSPTPSEYAMYLAKAASIRSLDLSRQVGAAIMHERGDVVSLGCNEVPRAGGGQYWSGDNPDFRDFFRGNDENDRLKRSILADLVRKLVETKLVNSDTNIETLINLVLEQLTAKGSSLRDAEIMDLLEFGRIIHAEMSALCDAARLGRAVSGATLFCTTFPCHICAKHIVAAGIKLVIYIEPYPKSYSEQLHPDAIAVQTRSGTGNHVKFEPFIGISPLRFKELFARGKKKDSSEKTLEWEESKASPIIELTTAAYTQDETAVVATLLSRINELKPRIEVRRNPEMELTQD